MPRQPIELAPGWPHKHFGEYPNEVHISPRTAYFTQDGKVMFLRLEELTDNDIAVANEQLAEQGLPQHE